MVRCDVLDRSLRPLFPPSFCTDTQLMCNLLAVDGVHDPGVASINAGTSAQLMLLACFFCICFFLCISNVLCNCFFSIQTNVSRKSKVDLAKHFICCR